MCLKTAVQRRKDGSFVDNDTSNNHSSSVDDLSTASDNTTSTASETGYENGNTNAGSNTSRIQSTITDNTNEERNENSTIHKSSRKEEYATSSIARQSTYTILWIILTYASKEFAKFLPIHQSSSGRQTFIPASYNYDEQNTYFDNTILTYGTDFVISIFMMYASYKCYVTRTPLGSRGSALFGSYAMSVFCGGYAHYTFLDVESMNTLAFKIWWIVCVGSVTAAGGFMGMCGSELCSFLQPGKNTTVHNGDDGNHERQSANDNGEELMNFQKRFPVGHVRHSLWWIYGGFLTFVCVIGEISYKRPACDIFAAGTTQFVPTVYLVLTLLSMKWKDPIPVFEGQTSSPSSKRRYDYFNISRKLRVSVYVGFFLNAPLLPSYPILVQYTNLSLGVVNALLHTNLTIAWGMQAWSIYHICLAMKECQRKETRITPTHEGVVASDGDKKYL